MRKFITSNFELDLSLFKIQDNEKNSIFNDSFFSKISYPFEIDLDDDLESAFGFISEYTTRPQTLYEGYYSHNDKLFLATFEVLESVGRKLSCQFEYGFDELPSWSKKLSELPLAQIILSSGTTIQDHANTIITQTWPAVNYNFPQIHTDKFKDLQQLEDFENIINKRVNGQFVKNDITLTVQQNGGFDLDQYDVDFINKNVLHPLPYILYLLKEVFLADGFILQGDVLNDVRLQKATVYGGEVKGLRIMEQTNSIVINGTEFLTQSLNSDGSYMLTYEKQTTILVPGLYLISGSLYQQRQPDIGSFESHLFYKNLVGQNYLWTNQYLDENDILITDYESYVLIDNPNTALKLYIEQNSSLTDDRTIADISIQLITPKVSGELLPILYNENAVDLKKCVTDITAGDLVKFVKNYMNYDISKIENGMIYFDKVTNYLNDQGNILDFKNFEVAEPSRKMQSGISFHLKFQDIEGTEYTYDQVFHNKNGFVTSDFKTDSKTIPIEINGLPLPLKTLFNVTTAHAFEESSSKVYLVIYDGIYNGNNFSKPITDYLLPAVHLVDWKFYFETRIKAHNFNWVFLCTNEDIIDLTVKSKLYCYNNIHLIKEINKTEIEPDIYEVEIDTENI